MKNKINKLHTINFLYLFLVMASLISFTDLSAQVKKNVGGSAAKKSAPSARPSKPSSVGSNKSAGSKTYISNSGNKTNNINSGNKKVAIDNSKKNINVNVNNSHNKNIRNNNSVRRNTYHPYTRPPYRYGGNRYYCYHPYSYHPYHPFYYGPMYHPWGFFAATLAATAIIVSIENQHYHYDQGVYYMQSNSGYTVVQAPVGATITTLPPQSQTVIVNETTNNYYYGGTYYEKSDKGYTVVPPTAGTVVENLPEGGKEIKIGNQNYVKVGETYYQPIQKDGKNMYEVTAVEEDDDSN